MKSRRVLPAAVLAVCGSQAAALPVRVALDWPSGRPAAAPARPRPFIQALRTAGATPGGVPVEAEAGPEGAVLDLGDGVWQLRATAPGYWSQAAEVTVGLQPPATVRLALWRAATLRGGILAADGGPLPRDVEVRLTAVPPAAGEKTEPGPARAELRCRIDEGTWSCPGPAGLFDARLEAAGFAPRYAWDVRLEAAAGTDLGQTVLRRAASVFGRAVQRDGSAPRGPCRATLQAEVARRGSPGPDPPGGTTVTAPLSRRGYFHLVGPPPGGHVLAVECPGASAVAEVRVAAERETRIDPALQLEELTLDVVVTPAVDPAGRPWQLSVAATAPRFRPIADKATASADGRWTRGGLTAGTYRVALLGSDGTQWLQRFFDLGAGSGPLSLSLRFVEVAGRVSLGAQPLRARLVFFDEAGGEPVALGSDGGGRFQGRLPVAPEVPETRWTVEVHAAQPPINRRLTGVRVRAPAGEAASWLELALPMVAVRGTVVSETGAPQGGVQVTFVNADSGAHTAVATDEAGSFELADLPPGSYTAMADSVQGLSERASLDVVEGVEAEVKLVLNRADRVAFQVVGSQGPVTGAAVQVWIPPGLPRGFTRTDGDGRFETELPPGTAEVGLTVGAPGHALKLTRLPVSTEQTISLVASGGRLVLDLQPGGRGLDGALTPYLLHEGAVEAAGALSGWGTARAGASGRGRTVVEAIEPGVYALCLAGPEELAALWRGALPPGRCRTGSVEPGGTLTLTLAH
jgi:carboxypeptidase family protein